MAYAASPPMLLGRISEKVRDDVLRNESQHSRAPSARESYVHMAIASLEGNPIRKEKWHDRADDVTGKFHDDSYKNDELEKLRNEVAWAARRLADYETSMKENGQRPTEDEVTVIGRRRVGALPFSIDLSDNNSLTDDDCVMERSSNADGTEFAYSETGESEMSSLESINSEVIISRVRDGVFSGATLGRSKSAPHVLRDVEPTVQICETPAPSEVSISSQ